MKKSEKWYELSAGKIIKEMRLHIYKSITLSDISGQPSS